VRDRALLSSSRHTHRAGDIEFAATGDRATKSDQRIMSEELFRAPQQGVIYRTFDRSASAAVRALSACYTGFVLDRLGKLGFMSPAMKPLGLGTRICGLATTVLGAELEVRRMAINMAQPGDVLVIAAGGVTDYACFGDATALRMQLKGMAGCVIDGSTRDAASLRAMKFPIFVKGITARNYHYPYGGEHGAVNVPIVCDGVLVHPGDVVLGDDDGIVVVPAAVALMLSQTIERELAAEEATRKAMTAFKPYDVQGILVERGYRFED
jgi:4-hydroxy-4-methyl-2-oxoglutarate aldolase